MLLGWMGGANSELEDIGRWRFWGCESRDFGEADGRFWRIYLLSLYTYTNYIQYASNLKIEDWPFSFGKREQGRFLNGALEKH